MSVTPWANRRPRGSHLALTRGSFAGTDCAAQRGACKGQSFRPMRYRSDKAHAEQTSRSWSVSGFIISSCATASSKLIPLPPARRSPAVGLRGPGAGGLSSVWDASISFATPPPPTARSAKFKSTPLEPPTTDQIWRVSTIVSCAKVRAAARGVSHLIYAVK